ncbi:nitrogenase component 1 [Anaeromyxobacter oryzae]|uniref:Hydrogenase n=1 Tax=Anaeromyxobacter oryzae TaxID=2918170 RepID=A0ABM7WSD2_9BACT|nr:nitrogenase component 1 [Anaeromyxobacter oryzae]BDG02386.1 hydrogenase [Anaeromyxobacter oryzae]
MPIHEDRSGCALHGALRLLEAVAGIVPVLHASPGCGVGARTSTEAFAGGHGELSTGTQELSATVLQEKQVVFGGTARLREQIKNTVKVQDGEVYVVVTGCVPEIVGDDVPAMVKEARDQRFPVLGIATPGFKGHGWSGAAAAARSLLDQLPGLFPDDARGPAPDVNLLGVVPGQDPTWDGDLLELEAVLGELGLQTNRLVGLDQGLTAWRQAPRARVNVVLSPWGHAAAELLADRNGTPVVDLGWVPVGSRDAGLLLERIAQALGLDPSAVEAARAGLDRRLRHFLSRASASLLLGDVLERVAVVGGTAGAVGQARFLAGTLGQQVERVIVTDEPPAERRASILEAVQAVAGPGAAVAFLASRREIEAELRAAAPELVLGSALEAAVARELGAAHVETAAPLRASAVLRRSHAGVDGALHLVESILSAVRRARSEPGARGAPAAALHEPELHRRHGPPALEVVHVPHA